MWRTTFRQHTHIQCWDLADCPDQAVFREIIPLRGVEWIESEIGNGLLNTNAFSHPGGLINTYGIIFGIELKTDTCNIAIDSKHKLCCNWLKNNKTNL